MPATIMPLFGLCCMLLCGLTMARPTSESSDESDDSSPQEGCVSGDELHEDGTAWFVNCRRRCTCIRRRDRYVTRCQPIKCPRPTVRRGCLITKADEFDDDSDENCCKYTVTCADGLDNDGATKSHETSESVEDKHVKNSKRFRMWQLPEASQAQNDARTGHVDTTQPKNNQLRNYYTKLLDPRRSRISGKINGGTNSQTTRSHSSIKHKSTNRNTAEPTNTGRTKNPYTDKHPFYGDSRDLSTYSPRGPNIATNTPNYRQFTTNDISETPRNTNINTNISTNSPRNIIIQNIQKHSPGYLNTHRITKPSSTIASQAPRKTFPNTKVKTESRFVTKPNTQKAYNTTPTHHPQTAPNNKQPDTITPTNSYTTHKNTPPDGQNGGQGDTLESTNITGAIQTVTETTTRIMIAVNVCTGPGRGVHPPGSQWVEQCKVICVCVPGNNSPTRVCTPMCTPVKPPPGCLVLDNPRKNVKTGRHCCDILDCKPRTNMQYQPTPSPLTLPAQISIHVRPGKIDLSAIGAGCIDSSGILRHAGESWNMGCETVCRCSKVTGGFMLNCNTIRCRTQNLKYGCYKVRNPKRNDVTGSHCCDIVVCVKETKCVDSRGHKHDRNAIWVEHGVTCTCQLELRDRKLKSACKPNRAR